MPDEKLPYLFAVYALTWAVFFVYAFFMARKQHELEREVQSLRQTLEGRPGARDAAP